MAILLRPTPFPHDTFEQFSRCRGRAAGSLLVELAFGRRDSSNVSSPGVLMFDVPVLLGCGPPASWIFEVCNFLLNAKPLTMAGQLPVA